MYPSAVRTPLTTVSTNHGYGLGWKQKHRGTGASSEDEGEARGSSRATWRDAHIEGGGGYNSTGDGVSMQSAFCSVFGDLSASMSDTSQLTDGVGTG